MNHTDRYAAFRQEQGGQAPYLLTPTHKAIVALWAALRYRVSDERECLRAFRQPDGRRVGFLAQLSEADGLTLRAYLQAKVDADVALVAREAQP